MQQFNLSGYSQINERFYYNRFIRLGTGAFGSVFKGYDSKEKRFIAVKQIPRSQLYGPPDEELKQIQIMKMLNHKNIMAFYGSHGGRMNPQGIFMFVQLCDKGTLSHEIAKKMTEKRANQLFCQLVDGMAYMHEKGIYHRDLKPDNLLITQSGQLKIADFGIAKQVSSHATFKKCTPVYSAPEVYLQQIYQKNNQTYNLKCDVFSAGYILYEMLTSEQLNKGVKTSEDLRRFLLDKRNGGFKIQHPALTQKHWIDLLRNMLSFDPSNRPTFKDIKNNLKKFLPGIDQLPKTRPQSNDQIKKSQVLVKQVKNFFEAVNRRNTYLVNVLKILSLYQQQTSKLIPRVYQILILYFTLARYCYLSEEGLKMISDKENLAIPKTNLSLFSIEEELTLSDKVLLNSFIKSFTSRISEGIQQMKVFVSNNIITELQKILRENETSLQRKVVKEFNIENNLKGFKLNEFEVDSFYKMGMKRCINNLYRTSAEIVILSEQDLRVYLISLYVANSDQFFDQMTYQRKPSLPSIQQILKMDRSKLQQAISIQKNKD